MWPMARMSGPENLVVEDLPLRDEPQPPLVLLQHAVAGEDEVEIADVVRGHDAATGGWHVFGTGRTHVHRITRKMPRTKPMTIV
jgi:hypothetical protein